MKVTRNFEEVYRSEIDPWKIGSADSDRYNFYYEKVLKFSSKRSSILDIGCGFGVFLARFKEDFQTLTGIEISEIAIQKGKEKHPFIEFYQGSADSLTEIKPSQSFYDVIICSDVICYLTEQGKRFLLQWIADHLETGGLAFIAAWTPGKKYLTHDEMKRLVRRSFKIEEEHLLDSGHSVFVCRKKCAFIAITIDYETWHPIPEGKKIDWEKDVFEPFEKIIGMVAQHAIKVTFMIEMGEYFWVLKHMPLVAKKMEEQWKRAIQEGHDVQLHLHPCWLPELGAQCTEGRWSWDWSKKKAHDYPGDLTALIGLCKKTLEEKLQEVNPEYRVTSFRAGAYQAQPFSRLFDALVANGIECDSSVYPMGVSEERGYDYSYAYSNHSPYWANRFDPQLKAPPSESKIIEFPIFTFEPGKRWCLDGDEGSRIAERIMNYLNQKLNGSFSSEMYRLMNKIKNKIALYYFRFKKGPLGHLSTYLPKPFFEFITRYREESLVGHDYFIMIGHTKGDHSFDRISENLENLKKENRFQFATLSEMVGIAKKELLKSIRLTPQEENNYQVKREYQAVMGEDRNWAQSYYLQGLIPFDRDSVLDLGCGAGYWSDRISKLYPWMKITGVDVGLPFIAKAQGKYASDCVRFQVEDFANLSFSKESFHCVYADNTLEHAFDVDQTLSETFRVLKEGGVLIAAIPSDGRNPRRICDNHTWKTVPHEVKMRLIHAGFTNIEIEEIHTRKKFKMPPYAPSDDQMMYLKAWKRSQPIGPLERAVEAMNWVYHKILPEKSIESTDPSEIISFGYALCLGYAVVLGELLRKEGFPVRWLTMLAKNHPRGRGEEKVDSHEVLLVEINGEEVILDPMANTVIPHSMNRVYKYPELAQAKQNEDVRYRQRGYFMYDTSFWYSRVFKYAVRSNPETIRLFIPLG